MCNQWWRLCYRQICFAACKEQKRTKVDKQQVVRVQNMAHEPTAPVNLSPVAPAPPSDKKVYIIPVTSLIVGQVMSKDDAYYTPHTDNPFAAKFKDASMKLVSGHREFPPTKFDLPSPSHPYTPPATPASPEDMRWMRPLSSWFSQCHSLPGSPDSSNVRGVQWTSKTLHETSPILPGALTLPIFRRFKRESVADDLADALSDTSSTADSALGLDVFVKDLTTSQFTSKYFVRRKQYNVSLGRFLSRSELMASYFENRQTVERFMARDDEMAMTSFSSSESCLSVDESALMSPTSSYSSDSDFWHRSMQWRAYEKLQSREKVQGLVRMWERIQTQRRTTDISVTHQAIEESENQPAEGEASKPVGRGRGRFEFSMPNLERKFQDLKLKWMRQQKIPVDLASEAGTSAVQDAVEGRDVQTMKSSQVVGKR